MQRRRTTTLAILVSLAVMLTSFGAIGFASEPGSPKYIIIMFADGAGPGTFELGRLYHKEVLRKGFITTDVIMASNLGLMIHTCAQALVCDSAATAMFTGYKTNIGMIGMTPNKQPVRNLAEAAKDRGYRIGLVSTDAVWDATPGAFSAHAESRRDAHLIAEQYVALEPTIVLGGGRGAFVPKAAGGERADVWAG